MAERLGVNVTRSAIGAGAVLAGLAGVTTVWLFATPAASQEARAAAAPAAPDSAHAAPPGDGKVRFSWEPSQDKDVTGYVVSWGDTPGKYTESKTVGPDVTRVELDVAPRPQPYYVAVQSRNRAGQLSGYSNEFGLDLSSGEPKALRVPTWRETRSQSAKVKTPKPKLTPEEKAQRKREKQEQRRKAQEAKGLKPR